MSVSTTITLPANPASGDLVVRPLGGDGYTSPQSYYLVRSLLASDAGGGTNTVTVLTDPQYQGVVSLISCIITSGAADRMVRLSIFPENWTGGSTAFSINQLAVVDADVGQNVLYSPPPMFDTGAVQVVFDNVDTESMQLNLLIYNFARDAAHKIPLNVLLASLPREFGLAG